MNPFAPALSVSRPWDSCILYGRKLVENRLWRTSYRGPVILHAAQSYDPDGYRAADHFGEVELARRLRLLGTDAPLGFVGVVTIVGLHMGPDDFALDLDRCDCPYGLQGQWHWELADPRPFPQVQAGRGKPGLFDPPRAVIDYARLIGVL